MTTSKIPWQSFATPFEESYRASPFEFAITAESGPATFTVQIVESAAQTFLVSNAIIWVRARDQDRFREDGAIIPVADPA